MKPFAYLFLLPLAFAPAKAVSQQKLQPEITKENSLGQRFTHTKCPAGIVDAQFYITETPDKVSRLGVLFYLNGETERFAAYDGRHITLYGPAIDAEKFAEKFNNKPLAEILCNAIDRRKK